MSKDRDFLEEYSPMTVRRRPGTQDWELLRVSGSEAEAGAESQIEVHCAVLQRHNMQCTADCSSLVTTSIRGHGGQRTTVATPKVL